jgi:hypothetical protein
MDLSPRLHSYVVDHDFGFAPNPFHGVATLATCKPRIRKSAARGEYVIGTGCAKRNRRGYLVHFMRVDEITDFDHYWRDPRFQRKKPVLNGSKKLCFGDNIYRRHSKTGKWLQADSFHSKPGQANPINVEHDTQITDRVLIARDFAYWGGSGPQIPQKFRNWGKDEEDILAGRGHKNRFSPQLVESFLKWLRSLDEHGFIANPLEWKKVA